MILSSGQDCALYTFTSQLGVEREIWISWRKEQKKFLKKKGTWPHLNPWRAQNPEVFIQFFPLDLENLIFIIKPVLKNNGADHTAGSTAQDESGISG